MMYNRTPQQIAKQLIQSPETKLQTQLNSYDQQYIEWQKSQLQSKLVPQVRKSHKQYDDYTRKKKRQMNNFQNKEKLLFTNMINYVDQKAYQYQKHDYQSIKRELELTAKVLQELPNLNDGSQIKDGGENREEWNMKAEEGEQFNPLLLKGSEKQQKKQVYSQFASFEKLNKKNMPPFLRPNENPYDRHANSKLLKSKFDNISYNDRMRNIAAMVETNKKQFDPNGLTNMFMNNEARRAYSSFKTKNNAQGTPGINHQTIYNNTMNSQNFGMSLSIGDVLKYTLGEKRQRQRNIKPQPIKNPFVRVPLKYSESLGDFYPIN